MRILKAMRIWENVRQGYEGASHEFTVYIIMKVSGTGYLEKRYFFTRLQKKMFFNPTNKKTLVLGDLTNTFFCNSVKKNVYLTLQVNISGTG